MAETVASDWKTAERTSHQQRKPLKFVILMGPRRVIKYNIG